MARKIAVFTGTRAEYGLLYWIIKGIHESTQAELQLYAGGMHLSPEFGRTVSQIENDGFPIKDYLDFLLSSDSPTGIAKSMGLALISAIDAFQRNKPDLLVVLGDRFESMAICQAAMVSCIPIAHIHGGELTEGLIDEAVRHSITKMSHLHFTATEEYRRRVIQLGEQPDRVYNFGAPGVDSIKKFELLPKAELSKSINFNLDNPYMVITYHPVTLDKHGAIEALDSLLNVLNEYSDYKFVITYPNADTHGRALIKKLDEFYAANPEKVLLVRSLGQLRYLSLLKYCAVVVGNSSSGLIEAPSFNVPTVNIGTRQKGRISGETVISCGETKMDIQHAIATALSEDFKSKCNGSTNPYGNGDSSSNIVRVLTEINLNGLINKKFYDLK